MSYRKSPYHIRHIRCNIDDFYKDQHRFRFEYKGEEYIASCSGAVFIDFEDKAKNDIPEETLSDISWLILQKITKEESRYRYPDEAYMIPNDFYEEEFEDKER